jgi:CheY-like chemotaxis protein
MLHVLIVEDQAADAELTIRSLRTAGLQFRWEQVDTEAGLREALTRAPDLVISDGQVPGFGGMEALAIVRAEAPGTPFILLSGAPWDHRAQEALEAGATEYVCKADLRALAPAVRRALARLQRRL